MSSQYQDLINQIKAGKVILVLGQAYLSFINRQRDDFVEPLLKALKVSVKKTDPRHLPGVYQLLLDRGIPDDRILRELQNAGEAMVIPEALQQLVQVPWRAIFFSGIDDLLYRAIEQYVPKRSLRAVYDGDTKLSYMKNPSYYHTIWLEGCMNQREHGMRPAITKEQKKHRRSAMKTLLGKIKEFAGFDCKVVIAGFNFMAEDKRLVSTLSEIIEDDLPENSAYLFPLQDSEVPFSFEELKEEGILEMIGEYSFPEFLDSLPKDMVTGSSKRSELRVNTAHGIEELTERELRLFRGNIIPLTEEILQTPSIPVGDNQDRYYEFRTFLIGKPWPNWQHLASDFVYKRKDYDAWLDEIIVKMRGGGKSTQNEVYALSGPSGTGKTVSLQYLAWMTAKRNYPVIFIPQVRHNPNYEIIRRFCEAVQPKERTESGAAHNERVLIAWDSLSANSKTYTALSSWLQSKGLPALVVGTIYNKDVVDNQLPMNEDDIQYNIKTFEVSPKFSDDESREFIDFLESIAPQITEQIPDTSQFVARLKEDIFLAMFDFLPETRRSRTDGVLKEIKNYQEYITEKFKSILSDPKGKKWKKLIRLAAVSTQYNCIPSLDLVLRALGSNAYNEWWQDRQHDKFNGIIKEYEDAGVPYLGMRNSRIAQIAMKNESIEDQHRSIRRLLLSCRLSNDEEREFVHKWVLTMRNPADERVTRPHRAVEREGMIKIYEDFIDKQGEDPLVLHQLARLQRRYAGDNLREDSLEIQEQYFHKALDNFNKALDIIQKEDPFHRSRERQNIINSIASVYRDIVKARLLHIKESGKGNSAEIQALEKKNEMDFIEIQSYCSKGRLGNKPSPYPYDVEVTSLMNFFENDRSIENDAIEKSNLLSEMLVLLDQAEMNFAYEDLETLLNTRVKVEGFFMDEDFQLKTIKKLEEKGNLNGYYIRARQLAYEMDRRNLLKPRSLAGVNQAYSLLKDELGDEKLLTSKKCLSLLERLWWTKYVEFGNNGSYNRKRIGYDLGLTVALSTDQWKEYHKILEALSMVERSAGVTNLHLRFMMAWSTFQIRKYREAVGHFRDLDRLSQGSIMRTKKLAKVTDETGAVAVFTGEVAELRDIAHGMAYFPRLNIRLPFNPKTFITYPKIHETAEFEIHLNYRYPLAMPASK